MSEHNTLPPEVAAALDEAEHTLPPETHGVFMNALTNIVGSLGLSKAMKKPVPHSEPDGDEGEPTGDGDGDEDADQDGLKDKDDNDDDNDGVPDNEDGDDDEDGDLDEEEDEGEDAQGAAPMASVMAAAKSKKPMGKPLVKSQADADKEPVYDVGEWLTELAKSMHARLNEVEAGVHERLAVIESDVAQRLEDTQALQTSVVELQKSFGAATEEITEQLAVFVEGQTEIVKSMNQKVVDMSKTPVGTPRRGSEAGVLSTLTDPLAKSMADGVPNFAPVVVPVDGRYGIPEHEFTSLLMSANAQGLPGADDDTIAKAMSCAPNERSIEIYKLAAQVKGITIEEG